SRDEWCQHILDELQWKGPVFKTSGLMSEGTKEVVYYLMDQIEQQRERELEDPEYAAEMKAFREQLEAETREQTIAAKEAYRAMRKAQREAGLEDDEDDEEDFDDDEDEGDVESVYIRD
ncbi:MAG: GTPase ObgE, partial [Acinetobacter sp.]|nr:GTPase ObgE [Acinetobacter sp.]